MCGNAPHFCHASARSAVKAQREEQFRWNCEAVAEQSC